MTVRGMSTYDMNDVLSINREAFGSDVESNLVHDLLADLSARPVLSLIAVDGARPVGHILFTKATLDTAPETDVRLLAPMAVLPSHQNQDIGGWLIEEGISRLAKAGVALVFVLGHPTYYPRFGFVPAGAQGYEAPYPIPDVHANAWMVRSIRPERESLRGKVRCADAIMKPEYWRE